jgi:hypothetical protein
MGNTTSAAVIEVVLRQGGSLRNIGAALDLMGIYGVKRCYSTEYWPSGRQDGEWWAEKHTLNGSENAARVVCQMNFESACCGVTKLDDSDSRICGTQLD